jgi:uncharacterized protein (TIGR03083 family)
MTELQFALAEADAVDPTAALRARVMAAAIAARPAGRSVDLPEVIGGAEVFRRTVERFDALLSSLDDDEWRRPTIRDLSVQDLVAHLIGVEEAFVYAVGSGTDALGLDRHLLGTSPAVEREVGRPPADTHRAWFEQATASLASVGTVDGASAIPFYGVQLPLEAMLVVRGFEMWIHDEDIRRATGRPLPGLDSARLSSMVSLIAALLPAGVARVDRSSTRAVRLVLTGAGGGTWDVNLDGADDARPHAARVVVDATQFCRVVGNRADLDSSGAIVTGETTVAADVFVGAAALALD